MYKKKMGVLLDKINGKYYAVSEYTAFELNEVGARILDLCNGENDEITIAEKISKHYNQNMDVVMKDVISYISILLSNNLIEQ